VAACSAVSEVLRLLNGGQLYQLVDLDLVRDALTTEAIFSDIEDHAWADLAASPQKYSLPVQRDPHTSKPSWHVFKPKLSDTILLDRGLAL
jgi:hypothetical protein